MASRVRWMMFGVGVGAGGSWWARRQARRAAAHLAPAAVGRRVVDGAGRRLREGWSSATSVGSSGTAAGSPTGSPLGGAGGVVGNGSGVLTGGATAYRGPRAVEPAGRGTGTARLRTGS